MERTDLGAQSAAGAEGWLDLCLSAGERDGGTADLPNAELAGGALFRVHAHRCSRLDLGDAGAAEDDGTNAGFSGGFLYCRNGSGVVQRVSDLDGADTDRLQNFSMLMQLETSPIMVTPVPGWG